MTDAEPDLRRHRQGPVDPTGAVSSGLQPGPLRGVDAPEMEGASAGRDRQEGDPERSTRKLAESRTDDTERNDKAK